MIGGKQFKSEKDFFSALAGCQAVSYTEERYCVLT